jgi:hypothetical protein
MGEFGYRLRKIRGEWHEKPPEKFPMGSGDRVGLGSLRKVWGIVLASAGKVWYTLGVAMVPVRR